jgi:hypothetical protein
MRSQTNFHERHAEQQLTHDIIADGGRVAFRFAYDPALAKACREIFTTVHGYYARDIKAWVAPHRPEDSAGHAPGR